MRKSFSSGGGCPPPLNHLIRRSCSLYHPRPSFPLNSQPLRGYNFVVELRSSDRGKKHRNQDVVNLINRLNLAPEKYQVCHSGILAVSLYFIEWTHALEALLTFWEMRLSGIHNYTPNLASKVHVLSDRDELNSRLRTLFGKYIRALIDGEKVKTWRERSDNLSRDIDRVSQKLSQHNKLALYGKLLEEKKAFAAEKELIERRISEFEDAMRCLLLFIEGEKVEEEEEDVKVLRMDGTLVWTRVHRWILRECRRLEDGLPIYAFRKEILDHIYSEQIIVLIGETGSGKSTQLVQFLADSGVAANESIICTQPRKIAAVSLAQRVREESSGCYEENSVSCSPTFFSSDQFDSKVIYMTDHCLLQHYMNDRNLSGISCIIVDEAHERSLNTDLLLALLKGLLGRRLDLRLVIMSATADANQLSDYFYGCKVLHVLGRNFPVDIRYIPCSGEGTSDGGPIAPYVSDVVQVATEIHKTEEEGTILAFLTSQLEVEWACERFVVPSSIALPLHGKLSFEEQFHVFSDYPGKRKIIFATNLAETSLTIPGVKYVIDSGLVKESKFEPSSGINILKVCKISQSSANQRAGRAGRTGPGRCYRLYDESDFLSMSLNQEPEIRRVHLGVAVLRIIALGIKNVQEFDFVDAPSAESIDMATRNLIQLGAITTSNNTLELTGQGRCLVKLGVEPRLGKMILSCYDHNLRREGLVLAAVMANASSIFCRVGSDENKQKADRLKVQFCHPSGDLFTLLSVYKAWETVPKDRRNKWCWEKSINAKSMRRCHDTVLELEHCLRKELCLIVPTLWRWNPERTTDHDKTLKKVILSSLAENVAMYSGNDRLGYEVALTGRHIQLHPSCSLLAFGQKPCWVVFGELLSVSSQYLVCVTAFDSELLSSLYPAPLFDVDSMQRRKLDLKVMRGLGTTLLKKFCGRSNGNLYSVISHVRSCCEDERINIYVNVDHNEIQLFATSEKMSMVDRRVNDMLEYERRWLHNECIEKLLHHGSRGPPSVVLFGAGAEIKCLELGKRFLTVDVFCSSKSFTDDKELLIFLERYSGGSICAVHKFTGIRQDCDDKEQWGRVTFLTPDAAERASGLCDYEFSGFLLTVRPSRENIRNDRKMSSLHAVKAKVYWPRRRSKGFAIVKCDPSDISYLIMDLNYQTIGGRLVRCETSRKSSDSVVLNGLDKDLSEDEILDELRTHTTRRILDFFLVRGDAVENLPHSNCEEALMREIIPFIPKQNPYSTFSVQVFHPEPRDSFMKALITFDARLHLEAAKALEQIEGKALPQCLPWQKIKCQRLFSSSIPIPGPVYLAIKKPLETLLARFKHTKGTECSLDRNDNGSYRVRISSPATRAVAELRRPFEELVQGKIVDHDSITPSVLQHLFSRSGMNLIKSLQQETSTYILFEKNSHKVRIFGSKSMIEVAKQKLVQSLLEIHANKQLEVRLRGGILPSTMMKEVVTKFGPNLHGLKAMIPGADFTLDARRHVILIHGDMEMKQKVEKIVYEIAQHCGASVPLDVEACCAICLCEIEDGYPLESCGHVFCRLCLIEQCEAAVRNFDCFPICCSHNGCKDPLLLTDLKSLLSSEKLEELFRTSLGAFVASSGGSYRFCPSPDCPSIYRVSDPGMRGKPFVCGACFAETCTTCHLEYHPYVTCEKYREFKEDPDKSLKEWCKGKEYVKACPSCGYTIEKGEGCNHVECICGKHICWECLDFFRSSDDCYGHMRTVHTSFV